MVIALGKYQTKVHIVMVTKGKLVTRCEVLGPMYVLLFKVANHTQF